MTYPRDPLAQRLLRLHEAQHLHLISPSFLLEQRFRCRFTTSFLMLLFTATRLEQDAGAVLKITRGDLAALLHCSPLTAQAAAQEAEAARWCAVLLFPSPPNRRSHQLPHGYALTSQFCLAAKREGAGS